MRLQRAAGQARGESQRGLVDLHRGLGGHGRAGGLELAFIAVFQHARTARGRQTRNLALAGDGRDVESLTQGRSLRVDESGALDAHRAEVGGHAGQTLTETQRDARLSIRGNRCRTRAATTTGGGGGTGEIGLAAPQAALLVRAGRPVADVAAGTVVLLDAVHVVGVRRVRGEHRVTRLPLDHLTTLGRAAVVVPVQRDRTRALGPGGLLLVLAALLHRGARGELRITAAVQEKFGDPPVPERDAGLFFFQYYLSGDICDRLDDVRKC